MIAFGLTDKGHIRKSNEDSFLCCKRRNLFVVADGMGGHVAGEVASKVAIQTINARLCHDVIENCNENLYQAVLEANTEVYSMSTENNEYDGMGTTLTAVLIDDAKAYINHVGDSRAYLIRQGGINLLTKDHSLVSELVRSGQITSKEAESHPQKHMLTRALGTSPIVKVDRLEYDLAPQDYIVLCTDGLTNHVSEQLILEVIKNNEIHRAAESLVNMALEEGGLDNITVIIVKV
ncbi:MAG: Stp1/IreP family PP2C-type Ser/Thr phosphatase [Bacillota bacterium]|nr:Stp1/IreP family PP2C-type Ser/Thr phosphatase [Bacillota bacterium]